MSPAGARDPVARKRRLLVLAGVAALFLAQAAPLLSTRWVEDENWYAAGGYTLWREGSMRNPWASDLDIESKVDMRPPGTAVATAAAFAVMGPGPAQARVPSVLAALGTVVVVFFLGAELGGFWVGTLAAVAAAADNVLVLAARTTRPEAFVAFFDALAVLLYLLARRKSSFWLALGAGASVGAAATFHPTGIAMGAGLAVLCLLECRWRIWRDRIAWALAVGFVVALVPMAVRTAADPVHLESFRTLYSRGNRLSFGELMDLERWRWSDYLGFGSQRFALPVPIPLRLHIALLLLAAFAVLWARNRRLFTILFPLLLVNLLWWVRIVNNTSRYFAIVAPILALAAAGAAVAAWRTWPRLTAACLTVLVLSQVAGNALLLYRFRHADYSRLAGELRAAIPPGHSAYGANTFWLALSDRNYWGYIRTPFGHAIRDLRPEYLILNDRVMVHGSGWGSDDMADLRRATNDFARRHATLVAHIPDSFYGDLDVYRVDYNSLAGAAVP